MKLNRLELDRVEAVEPLPIQKELGQNICCPPSDDLCDIGGKLRISDTDGPLDENGAALHVQSRATEAGTVLAMMLKRNGSIQSHDIP